MPMRAHPPTPLREEVLHANQELFRRGLARFTFGNASAIDRHAKHIVIKPSGVPYDQLRGDAMVVTDLQGTVLEGSLRPSSDLATHVALYRAFPHIGGIVHTHSHFATVWAQAGREIPCLGTTHADYFHGPIPVTAPMTNHAIAGEYEANTGESIVARFAKLDAATMPVVLVSGHASFCWGLTVAAALETASILEEVAEMAYHTIVLNADAAEISPALLDRHFLRKHGTGAYYGQPAAD
jgi:L-ribulose-5-phosphate 4-epimerase